MTTPVLPAEAMYLLWRRLDLNPWFRGADLMGIGADAVIEVNTISLADAEQFIQLVGGQWQGYPIRARKVAK